MEVNKHFSQFLNFAYRYLSYRMRTVKEVELYLLQKAEKKNLDKELIKDVLKQLKDDGYINDKHFIEEYVSARSKAKPKSEYALTVELLRKGISKDKIETYFAHNELNEDQLAKQALIKKWRIYRSLPYEKKFRKAADFLLRRGFSYTIVKKTIEEMESSE